MIRITCGTLLLLTGLLFPPQMVAQVAPPRGAKSARQTEQMQSPMITCSHRDIAPEVGVFDDPVVAPGPDDEHWSDRFGRSGLSDAFPRVVAADGSDVFVGGSISYAGGRPANGIARWNADTRTWHPLGRGVNGVVYAVATRGDTVYVAGCFDRAGDVRLIDPYIGSRSFNVAAWDRTTRTWSALVDTFGSEPVYLAGQALALTFDEEGHLWAGGYFDVRGRDEPYAPSPFSDNVAKGDGTTWTVPGGGVEGYDPVGPDYSVFALEHWKGDLYAGGAFEAAFNEPNDQGRLAASGLARWDGERWHALTDSTTGEQGVRNSMVSALEGCGESLVVGGNFDSIGGREAANVASWDPQGQTYRPLGAVDVVPVNPAHLPMGLACDESELFAGTPRV